MYGEKKGWLRSYFSLWEMYGQQKGLLLSYFSLWEKNGSVTLVLFTLGTVWGKNGTDPKIENTAVEISRNTSGIQFFSFLWDDG